MNMKKHFYLITIIALLFSNNLFSQKLIDVKKNKTVKIVEHLNTPTKIWVKGAWELKLDGSKIWKKGHWRFEERSFEQKSKIFKKKMIKRQQA